MFYESHDLTSGVPADESERASSSLSPAEADSSGVLDGEPWSGTEVDQFSIPAGLLDGDEDKELPASGQRGADLDGFVGAIATGADWFDGHDGVQPPGHIQEERQEEEAAAHHHTLLVDSQGEDGSANEGAGSEVVVPGGTVIDEVQKGEAGDQRQEDGEDQEENPGEGSLKGDGLEETHQEEETRRDYMRGRGFVVVNDTGHEVMEEARNVPVKPLRALNWQPPEEAVSSSVSLGMVTSDLVSRMQPIIAPNETFKEKHDVSPEDTANSQFLLGDGFGDLDFTWYFGAGVATGIIEAGVEQGYLTAEQQAAMTLGDWSDMIGSSWFSETMHDMALTKGGVHVNFGKELSWYTAPGGFRQAVGVSEVSLDPADTDLFAFRSQYDATTGTTNLAASVSAPYRKELRRLMKVAESPGCPVARHAGTIPEEVAQGNPHVQRQVNRNILTLDPARNGRVHFTQEYTPIDRGLQVLAGLLDTYDKQFGTPQWTGDNRSFEHHQVPRTNVLRHNGKAPFVKVT